MTSCWSCVLKWQLKRHLVCCNYLDREISGGSFWFWCIYNILARSALMTNMEQKVIFTCKIIPWYRNPVLHLSAFFFGNTQAWDFRVLNAFNITKITKAEDEGSCRYWVVLCVILQVVDIRMDARDFSCLLFLI